MTHGEIMRPLGIPGFPRFGGSAALTTHALDANLKTKKNHIEPDDYMAGTLKHFFEEV